MLPDPIRKFADLFAALPGIGPRQARRLAFYLISQGKSVIAELAKTIYELSEIKSCSQCFASYTNPKTTAALCSVCSDPQRRPDVIAVVEKETDLISLEKTKKFPGRYLILGELKKDGILDAVQKLRLNSLKNFIKRELKGQAEEIVLAINPTTYGNINAEMISQELRGAAKNITRLGRGIPTGGEIEFADEDTLGEALQNRS
jgi:recombination protein RecR